jgi:hypothetical protein
MKNALFIFFLLSTTSAAAQKRSERNLSFHFTNNHTAYPFGAFTRLFTGEVHPGFELGYGFNWKTKPKHDWYQTFEAGYFYHRFVQHAIPLYTQFGYRYKMGDHLQLKSALGGGYMHSVAATAVLKRNDQGEYKNSKGIGRAQAIVNFALGAGYKVALRGSKPITLSLQYQQRVQTPFVKSYVPLLPYNSLQIGFSLPLQNRSQL